MNVKNFIIIVLICIFAGFKPAINGDARTNDISNTLIYFEKNTAILKQKSKEFLDQNIDSLRMYNAFDKYSLLVQSIECKEEHEHDSLIGMKRRMAVYEYLKEKLYPDTLPIFIDEWQINWSRNVDPCSGAGAFIKLVTWVDQSYYSSGRLTDSDYPTFFIPFDTISSELSLLNKSFVKQYVDSIYSHYWMPKYTFVVYSMECRSELRVDSLIGVKRKRKVIRTLKKFSKSDIWLNVFMDDWLIRLDDSADSCNRSGVYIARVEIEGY